MHSQNPFIHTRIICVLWQSKLADSSGWLNRSDGEAHVRKTINVQRDPYEIIIVQATTITIENNCTPRTVSNKCVAHAPSSPQRQPYLPHYSANRHRVSVLQKKSDDEDAINGNEYLFEKTIMHTGQAHEKNCVDRRYGGTLMNLTFKNHQNASP